VRRRNDPGAPRGVRVELRSAGVELDGTTLLEPVSLSVPAGGTLVLRGANGSGKSTLLRLVSGLRLPTSGEVTVDGAAPAPRRRAFRRLVTGTVEPPLLARDLTLGEHVALVATTWGTPVRDARTAAGALLERLGIANLAHRFPHELSSGQTQLASLATVLVRPASLLLLDEPEQRLDADRTAVVAELLAERREEGATVLVATHSTPLEDALGGDVLRLAARSADTPDHGLGPERHGDDLTPDGGAADA